MSKIKTVIVVLLLVLAAGGSAFYGLTRFYQTEVLPNMGKNLDGSVKLVLDTIRVESFMRIQALHAHSRDTILVDFLSQLPPIQGQDPNTLKSTLEPAIKKVEEPLQKIKAGTKSEKLSIISDKGVEITRVPGGLSAKSLEGLPLVKDCLNGTMRDGIYELEGKLSQLAATPIMDDSGKPMGCLMSSQELSKTTLQKLSKNSGHDLALLMRKKVQVTTLDSAASNALAASATEEGSVSFGTFRGKLPLMVDLNNKAYSASVTRLPSGTDPVFLAVVANMAKGLAPLQKAQMMIIYATGGLFVFGLLLGLLLSGGATDKEFERLRDSVRFMADGNGNIIDPDNYSGPYKELARDLQRLAEAARPVTHPGGLASQESISQVLGGPQKTESSGMDSAASGSLDFESLLGDDAGSDQSPPPSQPPMMMNTHQSSPPSPIPADDSYASSAAPSIQPTEASPQKGPKVDMPGDLASFFDEDVQASMDQEVTKDAPSLEELQPVPPAPSPSPAPSPAQPQAPVSTPSGISMPPSPFPPDLDDGGEDDFNEEDGEHRPDATVIAQVPDELLKAAATASSGDDSSMSPSSVPPPPTALPKPPVIHPVNMSPEETHFREVFEDFIKTKKQCGEHTAGLTVEKFVDKLKKNSNDLKARYNCKSVTFQVYVKNGKAALKATPIK